ncbi:MAG: DnaJ domain-containing protein, partial [Pseudomonadota bacterium]
KGFQAWRARQEQEAKQPQRKLKPLEKKSITVLGLAESASKEEIKSRFKALVKRHHPDANGGDRGSEEKLREIIQAYNYLKQVGLV